MNKKVLIVDDDQDFTEATTSLLETKGFVVVSAPDGHTGFDMAVAEKPDLILLDVMMDYDSEGLDMVKKFKQSPQTKDIPIIMITGIRRAMNLPFQLESDDDVLPVKAVIEKPVKPEILLDTIQKTL